MQIQSSQLHSDLACSPFLNQVGKACLDYTCTCLQQALVFCPMHAVYFQVDWQTQSLPYLGYKYVIVYTCGRLLSPQGLPFYLPNNEQAKSFLQSRLLEDLHLEKCFITLVSG